MAYVYDDDDEDGSHSWDSDVRNPRFIANMAKNLYEKHRDGAYVMAVEKVMFAQEHKDYLLLNIWKEVLQELDNLRESEV